MLLDIRPDHLQMVRDILQKHVPQYEVWAFGSRAKWTAKDYSDLDLCIVSDKPLSFSLLGALAEDFSDSDLPWKVDVVDWASVSESFRKIITRDKVVVQKAAGMSEWPIIRLGDYIDSSLGKMLDAQKNKGQLQPYLGNSNVRWGAFDLADLAQMKFEEHEEERYGIRDGDLIVCEGGEPGRCAIWREEIPNMKIQKALHRVRTKAALNNYYLFYWFMLAGRTGKLEQYFTGTTIKHLTGKAVSALKLPLPPIATQGAIARILKSLDDKIELNRRMNETLEAIARAMFKSWFVDFDPVRAKMSGEPPESICQRLGLTPDLLALFPDRLVDSELGEIPEGWNIQSFVDGVDIIGGGTPKTSVSEYWNGEIPWFSVVDAPNGSDVWVVDTDKKVTREGIENSSANILPVGTTIISARGTVGKIALVGVPMAMNQSCYGLRGKAGTQGLFNYFNTQRLVVTLQQRTHGSVFDTITRATLEGVETVAPSSGAIDAFEALIGSFMQTIRANVFQSRGLSELRDTLLPKLLSGELRVPQAEKIMEAMI